MPRPKRPPHLRFVRADLSGPAYVIHAAKIAAGVPDNEFAPWMVEAIKAKLQRENPGLLEKTMAELEAGIYLQPEKPAAKAAEGPAIQLANEFLRPKGPKSNRARRK